MVPTPGNDGPQLDMSDVSETYPLINMMQEQSYNLLQVIKDTGGIVNSAVEQPASALRRKLQTAAVKGAARLDGRAAKLEASTGVSRPPVSTAPVGLSPQPAGAISPATANVPSPGPCVPSEWTVILDVDGCPRTITDDCTPWHLDPGQTALGPYPSQAQAQAAAAAAMATCGGGVLQPPSPIGSPCGIWWVVRDRTGHCHYDCSPELPRNPNWTLIGTYPDEAAAQAAAKVCQGESPPITPSPIPQPPIPEPPPKPPKPPPVPPIQPPPETPPIGECPPPVVQCPSPVVQCPSPVVQCPPPLIQVAAPVVQIQPPKIVVNVGGQTTNVEVSQEQHQSQMQTVTVQPPQPAAPLPVSPGADPLERPVWIDSPAAYLWGHNAAAFREQVWAFFGLQGITEIGTLADLLTLQQAVMAGTAAGVEEPEYIA